MSGRAATRFQPEDMQLLAWKFLDGCASDAEQQQLAGRLNEDEMARGIYLQCVQLHVDLLSHFGGLPTASIVDKAIAQSATAQSATGQSPTRQSAMAPTAAKLAMPVVLPMVSPLPLMNSPLPF